MEKRNMMLLTVIAIATLLVAVVGATFAYFTASSASSGESLVTVKTSSVDQTQATGSPVSFTITPNMANEADGKNDGSAKWDAPNPGYVQIQTTTGTSGGKNTCTFDIVYTPSKAYLYSATNTGEPKLKELSIITLGSATGTGTSITGGSSKETDITGKTTVVTLVQGAQLIVQGTSVTGTGRWDVTPRWYNLAIDQATNEDQTFSGTVSITNLSCRNDIVSP